jgi:hypothetical protein
MNHWRAALCLLLLAAAVAASLLAADLRSWRQAMQAGDVSYAVAPAGAGWSASTILPFDPALHVLDLSQQLRLRRAARSFAAVAAAGNGVDNGYSESQARGALEGVLTDIARTSNGAQASAAETMLGILAFADSQQRGPNAAAPVERSVAAFQAAAQLDPANEAAKYNLELLLHELIAKGERPGANASNGGPARGHRGAAGGVPGRGY